MLVGVSAEVSGPKTARVPARNQRNILESSFECMMLGCLGEDGGTFSIPKVIGQFIPEFLLGTVEAGFRPRAHCT